MSMGDDGEHPGPFANFDETSFSKTELVLYIPQLFIWLSISPLYMRFSFLYCFFCTCCESQYNGKRSQNILPML